MKNLHTKLIITVCLFVILTMGSTLLIYHTIVYRITLIEQIAHTKDLIHNWEVANIKSGRQADIGTLRSAIGQNCVSISAQSALYAKPPTFTTKMPPLILMLFMSTPQIVLTKISPDLGLQITVRITPTLTGEKLKIAFHYTLLYLLINLVVLVILLYFRIRKVFLLPLTELSLQARSLNLGGDNVFFRSAYNNAFDDLSRSLNTMLKSIQEHQRELELTQTKVLENEKFATAGRVTSHLAHDIGTPLNIIQGYAEILLAETTSSQSKEYIQNILKEVTQINSFIESVLHKSSIIGSPQKANVNKVCSSVVDTLTKLTQHKDIHFTVEANTEDTFSVCNPDILRQSITNLIINSAHSTQHVQSQARIHIIINEMGNEVSIKICDNGAGLCPSVQKNLFTPFTTTKPAGHGLGLFLSKRGLQETGGTLRYSHDPKFACCFEIRLPLLNSIQKEL